jgi:hypothetical protein
VVVFAIGTRSVASTTLQRVIGAVAIGAPFAVNRPVIVTSCSTNCCRGVAVMVVGA